MKIVIAPDSFKGSLTALEAAKAMERGIKNVSSTIKTILVPVADGGEGTMDSLVAATNGRKIPLKVKGPLLSPVEAAYGVLGDNETCIIEMASASGLCLLHSSELNPMKTTTFGTGQLIKQALDDGYRKFILAIGGSATNDAGAGMLQALGMKLLDEEGKVINFGGAELSRVTKIDDHEFDTRIAESEFLIATDVQNPLIGKEGASYVFGPQKGGTPEMIEILDQSLKHWADLIEVTTGIRLHDKAGAGAAGGIGGAFQAFFPSKTERGIDIVIEYSRLTDHLAEASCVLTGEGQIDYQTASGKTPMGVAQAAKMNNIPVFVLTGSIGQGIDVLYKFGITSIHSIVNAPMSLETAIDNAAILLEEAAEQVIRTFLAKQ